MNLLSFDFFTSQCNHSSSSCIVQMKQSQDVCIDFLSFTLQQNHIQSLTLNSSNKKHVALIFALIFENKEDNSPIIVSSKQVTSNKAATLKSLRLRHSSACGWILYASCRAKFLQVSDNSRQCCLTSYLQNTSTFKSVWTARSANKQEIALF